MNPAGPGALPTRVLLTGASRGIGAAIARALLSQGVRLAVVGRDRTALEAVVGARAGAGAGHAVLIADLEARDQVESLAERAAAELGGLDGLISCAGVVAYEAVGAISAASLARQMQVNFAAPFLIAQRAAELIAAQGGGAMLFVSSTLAHAPAPFTAAYAASKAALNAGARSLALELGPRGIRVNVISPGVVETDMIRAPRPDSGPGQIEALRRLHPLGRLGRPEDVAETALYLLRTPFVTGSIVLVDGGLSLGSGRP